LTDLAAAEPKKTELVLGLEGVRPAPITPRQELTISGKKVFVFDDIFTDSFVKSFAIFLLKQDYKPRSSFDNELSVALEPGFIASLPAFPEVVTALMDHYQMRMAAVPQAQSLLFAYAAAIRFGDSSVIHQDVQCDDCLSFLYYGNIIWRGEWGGETLFYDDELSAVAAVSPRAGRLVLFNAGIHHRAGIPTRDCPTFRYTFSLFYRCQRMLKQRP